MYEPHVNWDYLFSLEHKHDLEMASNDCLMIADFFESLGYMAAASDMTLHAAELYEQSVDPKFDQYT